jgi:hypothetical protein
VKRTLVIGRTNAGKTLFCIQFARYLGLRDAEWIVERADGFTEQRRMSLAEAERVLSGPDGHRTRCLQSIRVELPRGKGMRQLILTDTTGLSDGIHPEPDVRAAMAQTLRAMVASPVILHIVDAHAVGRAAAHANRDTLTTSGWGELDQQLATFGAGHNGYVVLANKMDLPESRAGYRFLCQKVHKGRVIPVSARYGTGFREVKQHVWRLA